MNLKTLIKTINEPHDKVDQESSQKATQDDEVLIISEIKGSRFDTFQSYHHLYRVSHRKGFQIHSM